MRVSSNAVAKPAPNLNVTSDKLTKKPVVEISEKLSFYSSTKELLQCYLSLSKIRLTGIISKQYLDVTYCKVFGMT